LRRITDALQTTARKAAGRRSQLPQAKQLLATMTFRRDGLAPPLMNQFARLVGKVVVA
jgi:hypothetical protein